MNISDFITDNTRIHPNNTAVICADDGRVFTWSELDRIISSVANALTKMGVKKGDVVSIYLPNSPEFIFTYFAAARIGAIALPFNILFRTEEIHYILNNSRAKVLVGSSLQIEKYLLPFKEQFPHLEVIITVGPPLEETVDFSVLVNESPEGCEPVHTEPDDVVSLVYTSGTSGHPKGAMITYGNLLALSKISSSALHINDRDLLLTGTPFCHICAVLSILGPFNTGAGIVTMQHFSPVTTLELIERYKITHFTGVPTMYIFMLQHFSPDKYDLSSLRLAHCAGAAMPAEYIKDIEQKFGVGFCELYGATETCSTITYNRLGHGRNGSVGQAAIGVSVKIVDDEGNEVPVGEVGEILVKGPGVFKGYWEMPEATAEAFDGEWYRTGDLGKCDEDGYFYILDRKKDMIVTGGYNVYPRELEEIIYKHPKILEAAVVGVKDPLRGEIPKAFIRLKEGEEMTEEELLEFCSQRMASYKVPRVVEFLNELPKNTTGKILKRML